MAVKKKVAPKRKRRSKVDIDRSRPPVRMPAPTKPSVKKVGATKKKRVTKKKSTTRRK